MSNFLDRLNMLIACAGDSRDGRDDNRDVPQDEPMRPRDWVAIAFVIGLSVIALYSVADALGWIK